MFRKIFDGALLLALLTGFLFCAGTAKRHGYFLMLGLDSDVLGVDTAAILYNGLLISYGPVFLFALGLFLCVFVYSYLILPAYIDYGRSSFGRRRKLIKLRRLCLGKRKDTLVEKKAKRLVVSFGIVLILLMAFLFFLASMESKGRTQAADILVTAKGDDSAKNTKVRILGQDISYVLLACGSRNCAALNPLSMEVQYFSQDKGFSYVVE